MPDHQNSTHWPSLLLLLFSLSVALLLVAGAGFTVLSGLLQTTSTDPEARVSIFMSGTGMLVSAALMAFPVYYSVARLAGWPQAQAPFRLRGGALFTAALIFVWIGSLAIGNAILKAGWNDWLGMSIINVLVAGIPIWVLTRIGLTGLKPASHLRSWGTFGIGMTLGPILITIAEIAISVILFAFGMIYLGQHPDVLNNLLIFVDENAHITDENQLLELLQPFLVHPVTLFIALTFVSVLVPLIEEALKPIGVWLMADRLQTPVEGFAMGILSGAGYALFENLGISGSTGTEWAQILTARIGTSLVHVLSTGLIGWALVSAWRERKFLRLGGVFTLAILLHGTWNALSILSTGNALIAPLVENPARTMNASMASYIGMGILVIAMLILMVVANHNFRPKPVEDAPELTV